MKAWFYEYCYKNTQMHESLVNYALITGASQGLGRAFAFEFANRNTNLILVALPGEGLPDLASQLETHGVSVHFFEADLSEAETLKTLAKWVNQQFSVRYLINNVGKGGTRRIEDADLAYTDSILQLNVVATALLTQLLLPNLRRQERAWLLNVSSIAAFSPIGFKTVYPASKAFIRHFSLGLREELRGTGVSVSVVYPGPMKTNLDVTQRIENQGFKGKLGLCSPEEVAYIAVRQMLAGRANIVPGFVNKLNRWLMALLPEGLVVWLVSRAVSKEL
jgi:short-subunit dehydrogenase